MKNREKWIRAAGVVCLAAAITAGAAGMAIRQRKQELPSVTAAAVEEEWTMQESSEPAAAETLPETTAAEVSPELTGDQRELLDRLAALVSEESYEEAARLMLERADDLSQMYYGIMNQERWLCQNGRLAGDLEGSGLVLLRPSLLFCGEFAQGAPEGECTAFQAIELDAPRYDYAKGQWESGRMSGPGTVGYCYYETTDEQECQVTRQGTFEADQMTGTVLLTTVNGRGETSEWTMIADSGALVLDDSWSYDADQKLYQLPASGAPSHAYIIREEETDTLRFQNPLLWTE